MVTQLRYKVLAPATLSLMLLTGFSATAQTNVFDDVIATSPTHTYLEAALVQENLDDVLRDNAGSFTVFAPDDDAFTQLATDLGTTVPGLLALPNLSDILLYHVLGSEVQASGVTNGLIAQPVSTTNTLKFTVTTSNDVYVNHAQVTTPDLLTDNGVVHVINDVVLPAETVADVAIDNGFSTLTSAVVAARLLPALTDPMATLTVFAPDNAAFDDLAAQLGVSVNDLLALPNLTDVLLYHVLGTEVAAAGVTNGLIAQPLSTTNTLKLTLTSNDDVYVNQAQVTLADVTADNGVVHVIDAVVLPLETVVDAAIDNGFSTLTTAVVTAELLPALSDPFGTYTVFAPTNAAFDQLATDLGTDINGLLSNPELVDILLYHVTDNVYLSSDLSNGTVETLNGQNVTISVGGTVQVNDATVVTADVTTDNGVVHGIDKALLPSLLAIDSPFAQSIDVYPNPAAEALSVKGSVAGAYRIVSLDGTVLLDGQLASGTTQINVNDLAQGAYILHISNQNGVFQTTFTKQ